MPAIVNELDIFHAIHWFISLAKVHDPNSPPLKQAPASRLAPVEGAPGRGAVAAFRREQDLIRLELSKAKDVMPLLMKRRNGGHWTVEEQDYLLQRLRSLSHLSTYLLVLLLPGSFFLIPLLAWWLDRRRGGQRAIRR
ncbi:MAG: hypothetical protein PHR30_11220 [Gallionellaceae bacterium]|nr:hypothetical protein [Gallionellaceae bacterium]